MSLKNLSQNNNSEFKVNITPSKTSEHGIFRLFEDILNSGLSLRIRVTGGSMSPFLHGEEILTIKKVSASLLNIGDLILFKNQHDFPILHRIIQKKRVSNTILFNTKGDALLGFDEPVYECNVLGKVCRIENSFLYGIKKHIDMESRFWKIINYLLALISFYKSGIYLAGSKIKWLRSFHHLIKKLSPNFKAP
jgi:signal peptidase I